MAEFTKLFSDKEIFRFLHSFYTVIYASYVWSTIFLQNQKKKGMV